MTDLAAWGLGPNVPPEWRRVPDSLIVLPAETIGYYRAASRGLAAYLAPLNVHPVAVDPVRLYLDPDGDLWIVVGLRPAEIGETHVETASLLLPPDGWTFKRGSAFEGPN